jgi:hypothetical protein
MLDRRRLFDQRVVRCSKDLQDVFEFLETVAGHAGDVLDPPTIEARGVGITHWAGGRRFCRFDPKFDPRAPHIFAFVPDVPAASFSSVGEPGMQKGWVKVQNLRAAVQLVPLILEAYREATRKSTRRRV